MGSVSLVRLFGLPDLNVFDGALCSETEVFDPDCWYSEELSKQRVAAAVCGHCPLGPNGNDRCLEGALAMEAAVPGRAYGVWGATTAQDRNELTGWKHEPAELWADVGWHDDLFEE